VVIALLPAPGQATVALPMQTEQFEQQDLGTRILVWGNSCSGKSTLAARIAARLDLACVDLDALNWLPDWVGLNATDPDRLERRMVEATDGDGWVVAGSYTAQAQQVFWPRLQTIIWLDLPMWLLIIRMLDRSWRRWRQKELLWGTNYEKFWDQLKVWNGEDSLLWWIVTTHHAKRRRTLECMADPQWSHIQFIRFHRVRDIERFIAGLT
jgi:adenylate kinase family enzyme